METARRVGTTDCYCETKKFGNTLRASIHGARGSAGHSISLEIQRRSRLDYEPAIFERMKIKRRMKSVDNSVGVSGQ
jgi:hypothetical protein